MEKRAGMRPRFFVDPDLSAGWVDSPLDQEQKGCQDGVGREVVLDVDDTCHALKVLRLKPGDECEVVIGGPDNAMVFTALVVSDDALLRLRLVQRLGTEEEGARYARHIGLVQALPRTAAVEEILEKGTELGASSFVLFPAANSHARQTRGTGEQVARRLTRWRRITREAAKQSKQVRVPSVELTHSFGDALQKIRALGGLSLVLEPSAMTTIDLMLGGRVDTRVVRLWVGPESGWTQQELAAFAGAGIEGVRLGRSILRTETAGPAAVVAARLALEDW